MKAETQVLMDELYAFVAHQKHQFPKDPGWSSQVQVFEDEVIFDMVYPRISVSKTCSYPLWFLDNAGRVLRRVQYSDLMLAFWNKKYTPSAAFNALSGPLHRAFTGQAEERSITSVRPHLKLNAEATTEVLPAKTASVSKKKYPHLRLSPSARVRSSRALGDEDRAVRGSEGEK